MKRLQAFKFQLRPGGQQAREMRRFAYGRRRNVFSRMASSGNRRDRWLLVF
ncbi:DNA-binding protein [Salmonella enterica subsp. enterica serovar Kua]|nr:DNA-binding protein [Salmonella enterica subsp. houtenae serovar 44:z4,z23:-]EBX5570038.1 DNA-binding protein [Salmonella enterica subsp. enterica serovar Kuessel]EBZ2912066.1 DNA-binding protein [Salmonella enterica subsp. enterica serovar Mesbit]ECF3151564.1 DNA-binding protein [Salmonella enterica subsp. enterica serovar Volkmarsdorf]EDW2259340.1 DNA-binding protein [Salmonella enterica subsp. enterica serovar Langford]EGJ4669289.1 DNA-binding protein [Salmonella enterica]EHZ3050929.1 D